MSNTREEFNILIENGWLTEVQAENFKSQKDIISAINSCTSPQKENIFNALKRVKYNNIRVLILGKDPYPNPKDAHGLAFSSLNTTTPDSLKNIFKAIDSAYGSKLFEKGKNDLTKWTDQGVLLLNTGLTFEKVENNNLSKNELNSLQQSTQRKHMKTWKPFVNEIIKKLLNITDRPLVFILWGKDAHDIVFSNIVDKSFQKYRYDRGVNIIPNTKIMILQASHPSPLSVNRGGDFPQIAPTQFLACNKHLGDNKVDWTII